MLQRFPYTMILLASVPNVAFAQELPSCPPTPRQSWTHFRGSFSNKAGEYVGEFEAGKINGYGTFRNRNGNVYSGNWKDSKRDGRGRASAPASR